MKNQKPSRTTTSRVKGRLQRGGIAPTCRLSPKSCETCRGFPACGGEQLQLPVLLARANGECYAEGRALRCVRSRPGDIKLFSATWKITWIQRSECATYGCGRTLHIYGPHTSVGTYYISCRDGRHQDAPRGCTPLLRRHGHLTGGTPFVNIFNWELPNPRYDEGTKDHHGYAR